MGETITSQAELNLARVQVETLRERLAVTETALRAATDNAGTALGHLLRKYSEAAAVADGWMRKADDAERNAHKAVRTLALIVKTEAPEHADDVDAIWSDMARRHYPELLNVFDCN